MIKFMHLEEFRFRANFVNLTDLQVQQALQMINAQFSGVYSLWNILPPEDSAAKRELCINYLLAWQLMSLYPSQVVGVSGTGGMPISSKKAGPISIKYKDIVRQAGTGVLESLTTNQFGLEALMMIQSAPENYGMYA